MIVKRISRTKFAISGKVERDSLQEVFDSVYDRVSREKLDIYFSSHYDETENETTVNLYPCSVRFSTAYIASATKIEFGKKGKVQSAEMCNISFFRKFFPMPKNGVAEVIWLKDKKKRFVKNLTFVSSGDEEWTTWQIVTDEKHLDLLEEAAYMMLEIIAYNIDNDNNLPEVMSVLDLVGSRFITALRRLG